MAHVNTDESSTYYIDQFCTISVCGALGGAGIMMYGQGMLKFLGPPFDAWVLGGSIVLVLVVLVRAVTLRFLVSRSRAGHLHNDEHFQGHGKDDHHHHEHYSHEHAAADHKHGWSPWRYAVLLVPVVLYLLNLPSEGFSNDYLLVNVVGRQQISNLDVVKMERKGSQVLALGFSELSTWAQNENSRREYEGYVGKLKGCFAPMGDDNAFTLVRFKRFCCDADMVAVKVLIICEQGYGNIRNLRCLEVEGQIQFRENPYRKGEYMAVLQVPSRENIALLPDDPGIKYIQ